MTCQHTHFRLPTRPSVTAIVKGDPLMSDRTRRALTRVCEAAADKLIGRMYRGAQAVSFREAFMSVSLFSGIDEPEVSKGRYYRLLWSQRPVARHQCDRHCADDCGGIFLCRGPGSCGKWVGRCFGGEGTRCDDCWAKREKKNERRRKAYALRAKRLGRRRKR